jgi:acetyltransferase
MPLSSSSKTTDRIPDLAQRPRRLNLDQIIAVKGLGKLRVRPISAMDENAMVDFHRRLSDESVYLRYFENLGLDWRTTHQRLLRICVNTPESFALIVEKPEPAAPTGRILAVGRLTRTAKPFTGTFDTLLAEEAQIPKLAKILLVRLVSFARAFGFHRLTSELLVADHDNINLCRKLGFSLETSSGGGVVQVSLPLEQ